ncbi:MAG: galactokinase [Sphingomonadaceae bacterium]|nr:galactokinase [Sphingomonadaceae bacterium]
MIIRSMLIDRLTKAFRAAYGEEPVRLYAAPGRVNLIGEHCDYNQGLVLPCAIDRETMIAVGDSDGNHIEAVAVDLNGQRDRFTLSGELPKAAEDWKNHVRGVAYFLQQRGHVLRPARLTIAGNVPIGAGLSSSASLGVATGLALSRHSGIELDCSELATIAQQAENDFVGCACGIMDQMASACSVAGTALLIDCKTMDRQPVAISATLSIVIADSGIRRTLTESLFNARRVECEAAARHLGVEALRDLKPAAVEAGRKSLTDTLYRRARHVVTEIARVEVAIDALKTGDLKLISRLMRQSHRSLRDDFEVSIPPIDQLVDIIAESIGDRGGVRMTGAGFGGCVVAIMATDAVEEVVASIESRASETSDIKASAEVYMPSQGAQIVG